MWNDFFTRRFRDGARPVAAPDDDNVIVAACESTPFSIRTDVKRRDEFWLKTQPYSLEDMLANGGGRGVRRQQTARILLAQLDHKRAPARQPHPG